MPVNDAIRYVGRIIAQILVSPFLVIMDSELLALDRIVQAALGRMRRAEQRYHAVAGDGFHYTHVADCLARLRCAPPSVIPRSSPEMDIYRRLYELRNRCGIA